MQGVDASDRPKKLYHRLRPHMRIRKNRNFTLPTEFWPVPDQPPSLPYAPVEDPSQGVSYMLCAFCDSDRLFRKVEALAKHIDSEDCPKGRAELGRFRADALERSQAGNDASQASGDEDVTVASLIGTVPPRSVTAQQPRPPPDFASAITLEDSPRMQPIKQEEVVAGWLEAASSLKKAFGISQTAMGMSLQHIQGREDHRAQTTPPQLNAVPVAKDIKSPDDGHLLSARPLASSVLASEPSQKKQQQGKTTQQLKIEKLRGLQQLCPAWYRELNLRSARGLMDRSLQDIDALLQQAKTCPEEASKALEPKARKRPRSDQRGQVHSTQTVKLVSFEELIDAAASQCGPFLLT